MKLSQPRAERPRLARAAEVLQTEEQETFHIEQLFSAEEWLEIETSVNRDRQDFSKLQDKYFLLIARVGTTPPVDAEREAWAAVGNNWVGQVLEQDHEEKITFLNFSQLLHCAGILGRFVPEHKLSLPGLAKIQAYVRENKNILMEPLRTHAAPVGMRIALTEIVDYVSLFPEDRDLILRETQATLSPPRVAKALGELAAAANWKEYLKLGAQARLLFPEHIPAGHQAQLIDTLKELKKSHKTILYTLLPDVADARILLAHHAELTPDGQIDIQDQPPLSRSVPLPERSAA